MSLALPHVYSHTGTMIVDFATSWRGTLTVPT
jgi:hypothetical protein